MLSTQIGILIAYIVDYGTKDISNTAAFRIPIGLQILWSLILCAGQLQWFSRICSDIERSTQAALFYRVRHVNQY